MRLFKRTLLILLIAILFYVVSYAWRAFPIITGYGAKILCSCTMLAGRQPDNVINTELGRFPLSLGSFAAHYEDSSATATVFGVAYRKAIYRKGLGCTLINEISEEEVRQQKLIVVQPSKTNQDTIPWPSGNQLPDSISDNLNPEKINAALDNAFSEPGADKLRRTRAVIIVHNGKLVAERYAEGFTKNSLLIGWSMTKSLTNAMVGLLVTQGKLDVHKPAPINSWKDDVRSNITLNDLLHASSGLAWEENYNSPSSATNMLFKKKDMGLYAAHHTAETEPGRVFEYSSGTSNIISRIIRETVGDADYPTMLYEQIFHKIGMNSLVIEPDAGGTFVGSSYSFASARDWARFGLLYLNDGIWNGERILPEGWVAYTTTPTPSAKRGEYGAQFWLNAGEPGNTSNRLYPDVPADMYWADGYEGQNVFVIPSKNLVIVKLSLSQGDYLDDNKFLADIVSAVK